MDTYFLMIGIAIDDWLNCQMGDLRGRLSFWIQALNLAEEGHGPWRTMGGRARSCQWQSGFCPNVLFSSIETGKSSIETGKSSIETASEIFH